MTIKLYFNAVRHDRFLGKKFLQNSRSSGANYSQNSTLKRKSKGSK